MKEEAKRLFNKDFLIRFYPDSTDTHTNRLIGVNTLAEIIGNQDTFDNIIRRAMESREDKTDIRLRRGIRITIVGR